MFSFSSRCERELFIQLPFNFELDTWWHILAGTKRPHAHKVKLGGVVVTFCV